MAEPQGGEDQPRWGLGGLLGCLLFSLTSF